MILGTVPFGGIVAPTSTADTYPVIDPVYGIDGWRNVDTIEDMLAIPLGRRRKGMIVGVSGGTNYYKLIDDTLVTGIGDWTEVAFSTGPQVDRYITSGSSGTSSFRIIGTGSDATGNRATAFGTNNTSSGIDSFSCGNSNTALGTQSTAFGQSNTVEGSTSFSEGNSNVINSAASSAHIQNYNNYTSGSYSHVGGSGNSAYTQNSFIHSHNSRIFGGGASSSNAILGGSNNLIPTGLTNSIILGGSNITATTSNTTYVPKLNIQTTTTDNTLTNVLVRGSDGTVSTKSVFDISTTPIFEVTPLSGSQQPLLYSGYSTTVNTFDTNYTGTSLTLGYEGGVPPLSGKRTMVLMNNSPINITINLPNTKTDSRDYYYTLNTMVLNSGYTAEVHYTFLSSSIRVKMEQFPYNVTT